MLGAIATLKIKPGTNAEFEAAAKDLVDAVNANEPGCLFYRLFKSDDTTYVMLEAYKDQAAAEAHRAYPHFRDLGAKMGPYLDGRPDVKILPGV